jgi:nucleoside-diphosphate-sugar epimerase
LHGTGHESRDYLHVDDLAAAVLALAGDRSAHAEGACLTFNLASGIETRIVELADQIGRFVGASKPVAFQNKQISGDPVRWIGDVTKTRAKIPEWVPRSISNALAQCVGQWKFEGLRPGGAGKAGTAS